MPMTPPPDAPPTDAPVVDAHRVSIGYTGIPVVHELDLCIRAGEVVGLLGPNGSGKSTLVHGMLGLATVLAGELLLFGEPVNRFRDHHRVGYVPQRQTVTGGIPATVREVVESGTLRSLRPRSPRRRRADRQRIVDAVDAVGLIARIDEPLNSLSGGQQRRALFARALASEPEFLILDEPTAGVDRDNQHLLADALGRVVDTSATVLLITHELGPVEAHVDRAIVLGEGRIVFDGPPAEAPDEHHDDDWHHDHHADDPPGLGPALGLDPP